ncbi:DUF1292 domain-containing protein [Euryarchaeota archaeon]|jgi:hypothetical protein|nr:DUF1292 domain-containing protein [Euryarchaeota archaeon]MDC0526775.1 DUF1292 domain-containing protein [Euryarchaeota archaeon]
MPIRAKLVHSVTLIAQPRNKHPMLKTSALKLGNYEIKNRGTFGLLWFTDFGEKFWEACTTVDDGAKIRLRESGFDEMNWSISFRFAGFKARLSAIKYKGFFGSPKNSLIELKIGTENPNDLRMFLQALCTKFDNPPWILNNWKKVEATIGMSKEDIIKSWSESMGREITEEETKLKGWGSSLFGSKSKTEAIVENDDIEIFEDQDGIEIKMKIHGALEVDGKEYAIMSYVDNITSEFDIMMINRGRDNKVSYSNVEDDELYEQLSEAAAQHLETNSAA